MPNLRLFDLSGRTALVTGGNGGLGRAIALAFAGAGASVAILGRNAEKNEKALAELKKLGARAIAIEADITERAQVEPSVARAERELGPVDILVNSIAPGTIQFPGEPPDEDYIRQVPLHRTGTGDDIADAALYLATAEFVTGQILAVDGGRLLV